MGKPKVSSRAGEAQSRDSPTGGRSWGHAGQSAADDGYIGMAESAWVHASIVRQRRRDSSGVGAIVTHFSTFAGKRADILQAMQFPAASLNLTTRHATTIVISF
jgi:hypothetical protein